MIALAALALTLATPAAPICGSPGAPSPVCAPADAAAVRDEVEALLGSIDRPVTAEDWRRLPPAARPLLEAIAADVDEFPSRRAHALDGLTALGADGALHLKLATDTAAPFLLRSSALAGVSRLLAPERRRAVLTTLLARDPDGRVRSAAAEALAASAPAQGCVAIRAQEAREEGRTRAGFQRALRSCGDR